MATRSIVTHQPVVACDLCGRRLLRGERPDIFLVAGQERTVCELCMPRATQEGWLRASDAQETSLRSERPRRGISLIGRLRQLRAPESREQGLEESAGHGGGAPHGREDLDGDLDGTQADPLEDIGSASAAARAGGGVLGGLDERLPAGLGAGPRPSWPFSVDADAGAGGGDSASPDAAAQPAWTRDAAAQEAWTQEAPAQPAWTSDAAAQPAWTQAAAAQDGRPGGEERLQRLQGQHDGLMPTAEADALQRLERALAVFNASEYAQRVAGISRSLGEPSVMVRPVEGSETVAILVAWELAWYCYGIDPDESGSAAVRLLADGTELHELSEEDRLANAVADDRGEISLLL